MAAIQQDEPHILGCLKKIVHPAKPPVNLALLVVLRVTTILLLVFSITTLALSIVLRPWKTESFEGRQMQIGLWTICRVRIFAKCVDFHKTEMEGGPWFDSWRFLLVTSLCLKVISFIYVIADSARLKNNEQKPWIVNSYICLLSGILSFCSLILFYIKFEFEFVEDEFRLEIMGWNEETGDKDGFQEYTGLPYFMCWCSVVGIIITSYLSYYTKCEEDLYIHQLNKKNYN